MKGFLKPFLISFISFSVVFSGGFIAYDLYNSTQAQKGSFSDEAPEEGKRSKAMDQLIKDGKRINLLLLGADGGRSDTMMLLSFDMKNKGVKVLSIPRDTYYYTPGYEHLDQRKINSVYGRKGDKGGALGVKTAIEDLTGLEVPYFVEVDYDAVKAIVDILGGVEFEVPFAMDYDDPYSKPPLHIHLKAGLQTLDGEKAMQFLRWRKNNGSEGTGDIDRIKRQQAFITAAAKKAFGLKLPMVIKTAYEHMETNLNTGEMLYIGTQLLGTDLGQMEKTTLPGEVGSKQGVSYLLPDEAGIAALKEPFTNVQEAAPAGTK